METILMCFKKGGTVNEQIYVHTKEGNNGNFKWQS
jgi:hypothetical protein